MMLRDARDARPVATVLLAVAMLLLPHWLAPQGLFAASWIALTALLCCACHVVVHNHLHRAMFRRQGANVAFNLVATIARGHCASDVYIPHNFNHHREQGGPGDWITPALGGGGHPMLRLARFTVLASRNMVMGRKRMGQAGRDILPAGSRASIPWEKRLLPVLIAACVIHDWEITLAFQGLPWALSLIWLVVINLFQHDACDPGSRYAHSRNFTGALTNWFFFNNGYHTVHHLNPGMHWTEAPAAHARMAQRIPAHLNERSILGFFWREYLAR